MTKVTKFKLICTNANTLSLDDLISHLCEAAARGNLKDVTKWLSLGAKSWQADYDGRTPMYCCRYCDVFGLTYNLLFTSHLAASEGHLHVLRTLAKDSGVDLNAEDRWGGTPLSGNATIKNTLFFINNMPLQMLLEVDTIT